MSGFECEDWCPDSNHTLKLDTFNPMGSMAAKRLGDVESGFSCLNHSFTRRFDGTHLRLGQRKQFPSIGAFQTLTALREPPCHCNIGAQQGSLTSQLINKYYYTLILAFAKLKEHILLYYMFMINLKLITWEIKHFLISYWLFQKLLHPQAQNQLDCEVVWFRRILLHQNVPKLKLH